MSAFEEFVARYPIETYDKGQTLLLKNETPKAVCFIEAGIVKAYTITPDGSERLVTVHSRGEDIPVGFAFSVLETSPYFYEAYTRCRVRMIPREAFIAHLKTNAASMYRRHVRLVVLLLATLSRVNALEQPRASDKIAFTLLYMADQIGVRLRPHDTELKLSVTQQEIANSLGLTRETAGTELKKLEVKNIISHSRKSYILYMERLRDYLKSR